jgi:hypothetical protein
MDHPDEPGDDDGIEGIALASRIVSFGAFGASLCIWEREPIHLSGTFSHWGRRKVRGWPGPD